MISDLLTEAEHKMEQAVEHANAQLQRFKSRKKVKTDDTMKLLARLAERLLPLADDVGLMIHRAIQSGAAVLLGPGVMVTVMIWPIWRLRGLNTERSESTALVASATGTPTSVRIFAIVSPRSTRSTRSSRSLAGVSWV